jgi:hypothetical protein
MEVRNLEEREFEDGGEKDFHRGLWEEEKQMN